MAYLEAHRDEMIAKAIETIQRSPKLMKLREQERRRRLREKGSAKQASANPHGMRPSASQR
jgi:hypothetical protein